MDAAEHIAAGQETAAGLSQRDREILEFERHWWKYAGAKEQAVREKFDMSSTRYYQVLNALIDRPEALEAFYPFLVSNAGREWRIPDDAWLYVVGELLLGLQAVAPAR